MKKLISLMMIVMMVVMLCACGESAGSTGSGNMTSEETSGTDKSDAGSETHKITLGINDWPGSYWWIAVDKMGYFKAQNVDVDVKLFSNYSDGLNALMSGNVDMFVPALADILPGYISGADVKVIMVQDYSAGADGLIAKKGITSVKQLKGKNIGIELGGSDHLLLLKSLENAGLSQKDVNLVNMSTGDAANAFISGSLDAAAIWEPSLSMAKQQTGGNILTTSGDKEFEGLIPAVLAVNGNSLNTKRDDMKAVMRAWFNARDAYENKTDEFAKAVSEVADVKPDEFMQLMKGCDVRTMDQNVEAFKDGNTYVSLKYCADMLGGFLKDNGLVDNVPDNYDSLFDDSLFDEVYNEMKQ